MTLGPLVLQSHAFVTELTCQMLIEGNLASLLFVHQLTFEINRT